MAISRAIRAHLLMVSIVVAVLSLSACGFALRGAVTLPFSSIYITLPDSSPLNFEIKRSLIANGTTRIASSAKDADVVLEVLGETREKQISSLNSQGRVREYGLGYSVRYRVINAIGKEFVPPTDARLQRGMTFTESEVLGKESEEALLYRDMQTEIVQQMMRRLALIKME